VSVKSGRLIRGHPYIDVLISLDGKSGTKFTALVDTGFSGFLSVPVMTGSLLGLKAHTTARYELADGKTSNPFPLAYGYACLDDDPPFVQGLITLSAHTSTVVGIDFLLRCGKVMLFSSKGIVMVSEADVLAALKAAGETKS